MTNFSDNFPNAQIMIALGDDITYQRGFDQYNIKAAIEYNQERIGNNGIIIADAIEIEFIKSAIPIYPQRGDSIISNTTSYKVDGIVSEDDKFIRLTVKKT